MRRRLASADDARVAVAFGVNHTDRHRRALVMSQPPEADLARLAKGTGVLGGQYVILEYGSSFFEANTMFLEVGRAFPGIPLEGQRAAAVVRFKLELDVHCAPASAAIFIYISNGFSNHLASCLKRRPI